MSTPTPTITPSVSPTLTHTVSGTLTITATMTATGTATLTLSPPTPTISLTHTLTFSSTHTLPVQGSDSGFDSGVVALIIVLCVMLCCFVLVLIYYKLSDDEDHEPREAIWVNMKNSDEMGIEVVNGQVVSVEEGSPADIAGITTSHTILAIDGSDIRDTDDVRRELIGKDKVRVLTVHRVVELKAADIAVISSLLISAASCEIIDPVEGISLAVPPSSFSNPLGGVFEYTEFAKTVEPLLPVLEPAATDAQSQKSVVTSSSRFTRTTDTSGRKTLRTTQQPMRAYQPPSVSQSPFRSPPVKGFVDSVVTSPHRGIHAVSFLKVTNDLPPCSRTAVLTDVHLRCENLSGVIEQTVALEHIDCLYTTDDGFIGLKVPTHGSDLGMQLTAPSARSFLVALGSAFLKRTGMSLATKRLPTVQPSLESYLRL